MAPSKPDPTETRPSASVPSLFRRRPLVLLTAVSAAVGIPGAIVSLAVAPVHLSLVALDLTTLLLAVAILLSLAGR